jgi:hypothetical protein
VASLCGDARVGRTILCGAVVRQRDPSVAPRPQRGEPGAAVWRWDSSGKRLNLRGRQLMNGIHAAFTGRIGKDAEVRTASDGKALGILPRGDKTDGEATATLGAGSAIRRYHRHRSPEAHQGHPGLL